MGIEHYAFAGFIAALICLIAIIFKLLFANVKRQHKLLDEKETNLLQLYRKVESIMEEFNDQINAAMEDIKEYESSMAERMASLSKQPEPEILQVGEEAEKQAHLESSAKTMTVDSSRLRAASEVLERAERMIKDNTGKNVDYLVGNGSGNGEVIQRLFDDMTDEPPETAAETKVKHKKRESILALAEEGKTYAQIARELGITQNEVKLVIGLDGVVRK